MSYIGDFNPNDVFYTKFSTVTSSGAPDTFTTSPAVVIYKDSSAASTTLGITLTTNFASVTGLNHLTIDTSASSGFYASGHDFMAVISAGQAGGVTISGYVVAEFSIQHRSPLRPTTASRTLNVASGGEAGIDWSDVANPTTTVALTNTTIAAVTAVTNTVSSNVQQWLGGAIPAPSVTGVPLVDLKYTLGTLSAGAPGYAGIDWSKVANPTAVVGLSSTTISTSQVVASVTGAVGSVTAPVTVGTNNDKTGYTLTAAAYNAAADALLARNIAGGSSAGRIVSEALYPLRNLWAVNTASGIYSVYMVDDATVAWTSSLTVNAAAEPITGSDPA